MEYILTVARLDGETPKAFQLWCCTESESETKWQHQWLPKSICKLYRRRSDYSAFVIPKHIAAERGIRAVTETFGDVQDAPDNSTLAVLYEPQVKSYAHQTEAYNKMVQLKHGCLFMEMGTGKTKVAVDLVNSRLQNNQIAALLYLCPVSVKAHIESQILLYGAQLPYLIVGIESLSSSITAFNNCLNFLREHASVQLVIDEAHLLKNPDAIRSKRVQDIAAKCTYSIALTGTPITQSPADLWGIFQALNPNKPLMGYSSYRKFEKHHLVLGGYNKHQVIGYRNIEPLMQHIAPMVYQISKSQCLDLPTKLFQCRTAIVPQATMDEYQRVKTEMLQKYADTQNANIVLAMFTELQKITTIGNTHKLNQVQDIYSEAKTRLVVWCKYRAEVAELKEQFPDAFTLDGSTPQKQRAGIIDQWSRSEAGILIANIGVGGLGIELTAGNLAVYYSNTFRYSDRVQSEDRFHRIGQRNPVTYIDLWTNTGIDRIIAKCLARKQDLADYVRELIDNKEPLEI